MSYSTIQNLLDTQLATVTGLPTLYKENTRNELKTGVAFSRSTLLPAETLALSSHTNEVNGLYQVDIFYPQDKGADAAGAVADSVVAAFARGLVLTDGVIVHIRMSWRETAREFQQFYNVPVVVRWTCLLPRG